MPSTVSLLALERDTAPPPTPDEWATPREALAPLPPDEAVFWRVLRRWDVSDRDGWQQPLTDELAERRDADSLRGRVGPWLERFSDSPVRDALFDSRQRLPTVDGVIDVLLRDGDGWHVIGLHLTERSGRHPWRKRLPYLAVRAWACRAAGLMVRTVGLLDLVTGGYTTEPAKRLRYPTAFAAVRAAMARGGRGSFRPRIGADQMPRLLD